MHKAPVNNSAEQPRVNRRSLLRRLGAAAAAFPFARDIATAQKTQTVIVQPRSYVQSDWMGSVASKIRGTKLCELPLPGSHDAGSYGTINERSKAQGSDIEKQLASGVRYFDFRVCVDNGKFYSVHGGDSSNNYYCATPAERAAARSKASGPFILDVVKKFCDDHRGEIVILNFSHFVGATGQRFNNKDERDFAAELRGTFGSLLIPPVYGSVSKNSASATLGPALTYGECITRQQRVVVIVDDDSTWYDTPEKQLWSSKDNFADRYSDVYVDVNVAPPIGDLQAKIEKTLDDQEQSLKSRSMRKIWVTQAVLNYAAVVHNGHAQNYTGAEKMNIQFTSAYREWRKGNGRNGKQDPSIRKPNVLLMDYSDYFGVFTQACIDMCNAGL